MKSKQKAQDALPECLNCGCPVYRENSLCGNCAEIYEAVPPITQEERTMLQLVDALNATPEPVPEKYQARLRAKVAEVFKAERQQPYIGPSSVRVEFTDETAFNPTVRQS